MYLTLNGCKRNIRKKDCATAKPMYLPCIQKAQNTFGDVQNINFRFASIGIRRSNKKYINIFVIIINDFYGVPFCACHAYYYYITISCCGFDT